jgi:YgiT-type zinc finger domain-containing protein
MDPCPKCGALRSVEILYGKPLPEALEQAHRGEIELGGCIATSSSPAWRCTQCGERYGTNEWLQSLRSFEGTAEEAAKWRETHALAKIAKKERQRVLKARLREQKKP